MAVTLVASNAAIAATTIDVNIMVPKSIVDKDESHVTAHIPRA